MTHVRRTLFLPAASLATFVAVIALLVWPVRPAANPLDEVTFYTEQFPPLNFREDGQLKGIAVDIAEAVLKKAGSSQRRGDFRLVQWSKGYGRAMARSDTVLFSTARVPEREDDFIFVAPFALARLVLFVRERVSPKPSSVRELIRSDLDVAVLRDDVGQQVLQQRGVPRAQLVTTGSKASAIELLRRERADAWAYSANAGGYALKQHGMRDAYAIALTLKSGANYFAFNPETDPAAIRAFRNAFYALKREGRIAEIRNQYVR
jgi:polar amino acid transport system substrate-binding protein